MPLGIGQVIQNRYRIEALLGQGGFGAVYRALDLNLNTAVAIKENLDSSPEAQRQFAREAGLLVNLRHPSLPRVTDYFFLPGQGQYLVMDFIAGQDLQEMLDQHSSLDEARAVAWMSQVLDALAYLHAQNPPIIHRDLKPANIRVTPDGRAILVDFGVAKLYDPRLLTTTGARAVTPGYSPWEQYGQGGTDARSDVYAAGATLYTLLTGQVPPESIALTGGTAQLIPPRRVNPRVSAQIESVILKAMTTQPTGRFVNAGQMQIALNLAKARVTEGRTPSQGSSGNATSWPLGVAGVIIMGVIIALSVALMTSHPQTIVTVTRHLTTAVPTPIPSNTPVVVAPTEPDAPMPTATPVTPSKATAVVTATPRPAPTALGKDVLARVSLPEGLKIKVRDKASATGAILGELATDAQVTILEGPTDANGIKWWKVDNGKGLIGWMAEGLGTDKYLVPIGWTK